MNCRLHSVTNNTTGHFFIWFEAERNTFGFYPLDEMFTNERLPAWFSSVCDLVILLFISVFFPLFFCSWIWVLSFLSELYRCSSFFEVFSTKVCNSLWTEKHSGLRNEAISYHQITFKLSWHIPLQNFTLYHWSLTFQADYCFGISILRLLIFPGKKIQRSPASQCHLINNLLMLQQKIK